VHQDPTVDRIFPSVPQQHTPPPSSKLTIVVIVAFHRHCRRKEIGTLAAIGCEEKEEEKKWVTDAGEAHLRSRLTGAGEAHLKPTKPGSNSYRI